MEKSPTYYDFLKKIIPIYGKFSTFPKGWFSIKVFHNPKRNPLWAMENHVDNVEKQAKSRVFSEDFIFCLWKTFFKNLVKSFFEKKHFPRFAQIDKIGQTKNFFFFGEKKFFVYCILRGSMVK